MSDAVRQLIEALVVLTISVVVAAVLNKVLGATANKLARASKQGLAEGLLRAVRLPVAMLIVLAGVALSLDRVGSIGQFLHQYATGFEVACLIVVLIALTNVANLLSVVFSRKLAAENHQSHVSLMKKIAILAIWILGSVQILSMFGVKVTAVLASLGVAGLAVGLALQDTIANLFGGFYLVADRSIRAGDYIKLDTGQEGFVEAVEWRNTRIRLWANNVVLVPNAKLTQSIITNMTLPDSMLSVYTNCGVGYDSDLDQVEAVTLEVARRVIREYPGADTSFEPVLRYKEFGDSNIQFLVIFRAADVGSQYLLQHEFIKGLHRRFAQEGIEISYPVRKLVWGDGQKPRSEDGNRP